MLKRKQEAPLKVLEKANDWKADFDLHSAKEEVKYSMDQRVCSTTFKPDGYVVSHEEKLCVVIELTCPMEENMDKWHLKKKEKYKQELQSEVYEMIYVVVEVGARGGMLNTLRREFRRLGLTKAEVSKLVDECRRMAERCSFAVWCQRFTKDFVATEMLL